MSKEKAARRKEIGGPMHDPGNMAKQMAVVPGGPPEYQRNMPQNVTSQMGPAGGYKNMYEDAVVADDRTTGNVGIAGNSGVPQFAPVFSRPDQPDPRMEEQIEAQRLNDPVKTNPIAKSSMMGIIGMGPQGAPGAVPPQFPGNGPGFMPSTDQYLMTPGSTPRKEGKSKK